MQHIRWRRYLLLMLWATLPGCVERILRAEGPLEYSADPQQIAADRQLLATQIDSGYLTLNVPSPPGDKVEGWEPLFSFVQVSDVQLRDSAIHYFAGAGQESVVDLVATSTKRDPKLDKNDEFPLAALVGGLNDFLKTNHCDPHETQPKRIQSDPHETRPISECPRFLIHTGDTIDAGTVGELHRFLSISNRLRLPWYNVIGNHDIFLMGNFTESEIQFKNLPTDAVPLVLNRERFMRLHGPGDWLSTLSHLPTKQGWYGMPKSHFHGFDRLMPGDREFEPGLPLRPYYSLRFPIASIENRERSVRLVVLDTTVQHEMVPRVGKLERSSIGARGYVEPEQYAWLKREIADAEAKGDLVLVFGHHPLLAPTDWDSKVIEGLGDLLGTDPSGIRDIPVKNLFAQHPGLLAYFGGHTHIMRLTQIANGSGAVEVIAPSLHELPQLGFLITIYQQKEGSRLGLLIRSIQGQAGRNDLLAQRLRESCEGALRDKNKKPGDYTPTCGTVVSEFLELPRQPVISKSCPLSDPAPELLNRPFPNVAVQWDPLPKTVSLRGSLFDLQHKSGLDCVQFWLAPEVASRATFPVELSPELPKPLPIGTLLDYLVRKIPAACHGSGQLFRLAWKYDSLAGQFLIYGIPDEQALRFEDCAPPQNSTMTGVFSTDRLLAE